MKAFRKFTIILLAVMLLALCGCQSGEQKLEELQEKTEQLIADGKFEEAIEGCDKALEDGLDKEEVYSLIQFIYTDWAMNTLTETGSNIAPSLQIIDQMIEKYPDLQESGENIILDLGKWTLESYGEDVEGMKKVFDSFIGMYNASDIICEGLDAKFLELVTDLMDEKTDELIDNGLLNDINADSYEDVFDRIDDFRLLSYKTAISYPRLFPYVKDLGDGKVLKIEYISTFFTMYYGALDSRGMKTGEAVQLTYAVNMNEQDKYQKEYLRGRFEDDMVNGPFVEYMYKCINSTSVSVNSGEMIDNKYNGEIRSHHENNGKTHEYVFNFEEGAVVVIGELTGYPGYYAVGIDTLNGPDDPAYFGFKEESLKEEIGFYPYYRSIY